MRHALLLLLLTSLCSATATKIQVVDASGAPAQDVLVIVKALDHYGELARRLTDQQGGIGSLGLKPGIYRAIATTPYGLWQTEIREFVVSDTPVEVQLTVKPRGTHGFGDVVTLGGSSADLQVLGTDGKPAGGAEVLVRDKDATLSLERWYKTDANGKAKVELVGHPTVVVVILDGKLTTAELSSKQTHAVIHLSQH